jgi:prevent-host-death family protein
MRIQVSAAEAKKRFSELLARVGFGGATVVILRRGRPVARLVPLEEPAGSLGELSGWLDAGDPFFGGVEEIVAERSLHPPRVLPRRARGRTRRSAK